jgi:hypothetical protein
MHQRWHRQQRRFCTMHGLRRGKIWLAGERAIEPRLEVPSKVFDQRRHVPKAWDC